LDKRIIFFFCPVWSGFFNLEAKGNVKPIKKPMGWIINAEKIKTSKKSIWVPGIVPVSWYKFLIRVTAAGINTIINNKEDMNITLVLLVLFTTHPPSRAPKKIPISQFDRDIPNMNSFPRTTTSSSLNNNVWVVMAIKPVKKKVIGMKNGDNFSVDDGWLGGTILVN
jgi:hypothetical protein